MRPFKIKYGKRKEKGYLPNSWADVDFKTFIKFFDESVKGSIEGVFSVLTGTSKEIWSMPHKAELFANISDALSFTKLNPHCELPTHITYDDGPLRKVEKDLMNLLRGQLRVFLAFSRVLLKRFGLCRIRLNYSLI